MATSKDISKADKGILSARDDIRHEPEESLKGRQPSVKIEVEEIEENKIDYYVDQYDKIIKSSDDVIALLDKKCEGFVLEFNPAEQPELSVAAKKIFGETDNKVTFDMYKQALEEQINIAGEISNEMLIQ